MRRLAILAAFFATVLGITPDVASAGRRAPERGDHVVAVSRYGNGSVSGPIRATSTGYEVRLPRGTWVACRRSCAETLRVETIDFFENEGSLTGYGTAMNECGIFGCLEWRRRW
jgi:hypothetical protein